MKTYRKSLLTLKRRDGYPPSLLNLFISKGGNKWHVINVVVVVGGLSI